MRQFFGARKKRSNRRTTASGTLAEKEKMRFNNVFQPQRDRERHFGATQKAHCNFTANAATTTADNALSVPRISL